MLNEKRYAHIQDEAAFSTKEEANFKTPRHHLTLKSLQRKRKKLASELRALQKRQSELLSVMRLEMYVQIAKEDLKKLSSTHIEPVPPTERSPKIESNRLYIGRDQ